jgi:hypothetical protein
VIISVWKIIKRGLRWGLLWLLALLLLRYSTLPLGESWARIGLLVGDRQFDYLGWETEAIFAKAAQSLWGAHPFMAEADRVAFARAYFSDIARAQALDAEIERAYADPSDADPAQTTAASRADRDALRADLRERQGLAEAIIEGQVAAVLVDEGFGLLGQLVPPIAMRFTPLPQLLVVSPRDRIEIAIGVNLDPMPVDQREILEAQLDAQEDVSTLVVPLGGIALYPAMIVETANLDWAVETFAHEWFHHYLFMYPLGWSLDWDAEARLINETAANLFGQEVAPLVLARYYATPAAATGQSQRVSDNGDATAQEPPPVPPFDFGATMNETRVQVDALLADGEIEQAEAYMHDQRALFFENGYAIRKLNQAFFAFYGGYQVGGVPGIAGADPIGEGVTSLRAQAGSLAAFAARVRSLTTRADLLAAITGE